MHKGFNLKHINLSTGYLTHPHYLAYLRRGGCTHWTRRIKVCLSADEGWLHRCTAGKMSCLATVYPISAWSCVRGIHLENEVVKQWQKHPGNPKSKWSQRQLELFVKCVKYVNTRCISGPEKNLGPEVLFFFYSKSFVTLSISKHDQYSHFVIYKSTIKNLTLKLNYINEVLQSNQGKKQSCWFSFQVICHFFSHQTLTWIYILTGIHCQEPRNGVQLEGIITNTVHTVNVNKWKTVKVYFWLTAL